MLGVRPLGLDRRRNQGGGRGVVANPLIQIFYRRDKFFSESIAFLIFCCIFAVV